MHPKHRRGLHIACIALAALMLGACATGAPSGTSDPAARQEYNKQKQQDLEKMIDEGMEMR